MAEQLLNTGSKTRTSALLSNKTIKLACRNYELYLFLLPALVYYVIFCYWPMYGLQIAFKDFTASLGILASPGSA
jgi:putative aldouronate transport system permease protein